MSQNGCIKLFGNAATSGKLLAKLVVNHQPGLRQKGAQSIITHPFLNDGLWSVVRIRCTCVCVCLRFNNFLSKLFRYSQSGGKGEWDMYCTTTTTIGRLLPLPALANYREEGRWVAATGSPTDLCYVRCHDTPLRPGICSLSRTASPVARADALRDVGHPRTFP